LEEGFKLLQSGHSVGEASKISGVPRTTLYSKARSCGVICLKETTKKYTPEQIEQAVKAVAGNNIIFKLCTSILILTHIFFRWPIVEKYCRYVWGVKNCPMEKISSLKKEHAAKNNMLLIGTKTCCS